MTFSISKKYKIQPYFYKEKLGGGKVLSEFIESNKDQAKAWVDLVSLQKQKKIRWTLHDIYDIPKFEEIADIYTFIEHLEWRPKDIEHSDFKEHIIRDLCLAYKLATEYLRHEDYYIPNLWNPPKSSNELINTIHRWQKLRGVQDRIGYCTILKEVLWFFRIIRFSKFSVNYETWKVDLRNKEFIQEVIDIFSAEEFQYKEGSQTFSQTSNNMSWELLVDNKKFPIYAWFDVKSLYSMIEKMDGQEKYNLPEAFKDIHRMRIEVQDPNDALRTAKILFQKFWEDLVIDNVGSMISQEVCQEYLQQFCSRNEDASFRETLEKNFMEKEISTNVENKKSYSSERQELRLSRKWETPIEIQIVLVNNNNETGWAHHDVYKIRRKIIAKIRRHGWIGIKGIEIIIDAVVEQNKKENNGKYTIPYLKEQIYKHIIGADFLIGIHWKSEWGKDRKRVSPRHFSTKEVLEKYQKNYPTENSLWKIDVFIKNELQMWGFMPLKEISFPSKTETVSQPPLKDQ